MQIRTVQTLLKERSYQEALLVLESTPQSYGIYEFNLTKGICAYKLKKYDCAREALKTCDQLNTQNQQHYVYLAKLATSDGDIELAINLIDNMIKRNPENADYYIMMAKAFRMKKQTSSSIGYLKKAEQVDKSNYKVYKEWGLCFFNDDYVVSLDYFLKSYSLNPNHISVIEHIGYVYMRMSDYQSALSILLKAVELNPKDKKYYYLVGLCYIKVNLKAEALKYLKIAIEIDSNDPNIYFMVGVTEREIGDYHQAISSLEKSIQCRNLSNAHEKYNELGLCYLNIKDHVKALYYFKKAIENKADYAAGHSNVGLCYYLSKNYKEALESLKTAVRLDNQLIDAYSNLGLVYMTIENYKEAENNYNKVVIYNEYRYDALIKLGAIKMKRKKYSDAKKYFKTAAELNKNLPIAFYNLGLVYADLRKCKKARENFNKALECDPQYKLAEKSIKNLEVQQIDEQRNKKPRSIGCVGFLF